MSLNDPLAQVLSKILTFDKKGRKEVVVKANSNLIRSVLSIMMENNYIGQHEEVDESKKSTLKINLLGKLNDCGVIKPRFNVKNEEFQKFEKRYLPAYGFGILIVSTNEGIMTQEAAVKKGKGGKLIAYVY